jgi:oligosaccharide reducing-end xylanase
LTLIQPVELVDSNFLFRIETLPTLRRYIAILLLLTFLLTSCGSPSTPIIATMESIIPSPTPVPAKPAYETGVYPNLFMDYLGKSDKEIQAKIDSTFNQLFYGNDATERVYYPVGSDMAYISDIANEDVRSEGMSYGMMIAVQLNKKEEFDRLWKWVKTYMYQTDGGYKGYFAWHCKTDGTQLAANPASDGEVWFITALFFADGRWSSGEGIYNYRAEAQSILDTALHDDDRGDLATNLFDPETKQVVFVPQLGQNSQFTDPSYHMPHYYELWARWADKDNQFWADAVTASREYLPKAVNPQTGLAPNYSYFDGSPYNDEYNGNFRYDAFRVGANVGMDYIWFAPSGWQVEQSNRLLKFFASQGMEDYKAEYTLDGKPEVGHRSPGLMATNAVAALAADREIGEPFVQALWDQPLPTGQYRYYDGLLMMLALLQVSGNFRIYEPGTAPTGQVFPTLKPELNGKFTPQSGKALLLAGDDKNSVDAYFDATVTPPGGVAMNIDLLLDGIEDLDYLAGKYSNSTLSVGVDFTDIPTNEQIDPLLDVLIAYNRPVFLRLGFGEDAVPDAYLSAWERFGERVQAKGSTNIVLVWESVSCEVSNLADFYPGDENVVWVGTNYECADGMIQFAREHFRPVMVTAGSQGAGWEEWFVPFIQFVNDNNDVVRAVTYINTGESRLSNADVIKNWKTETKKSFWLRANPDLFGDLGFEK